MSQGFGKNSPESPSWPQAARSWPRPVGSPLRGLPFRLSLLIQQFDPWAKTEATRPRKLHLDLPVLLSPRSVCWSDQASEPARFQGRQNKCHDLVRGVALSHCMRAHGRVGPASVFGDSRFCSVFANRRILNTAPYKQGVSKPLGTHASGTPPCTLVLGSANLSC